MVAFAPLFFGGVGLGVTANDVARQRLSIPYGDDYSLNITIELPVGADVGSCSAVLGVAKDDEQNIGIQKSTVVDTYAGVPYVQFSLTSAEFLQLKPGLYHYDIEVRSGGGEFWTRVIAPLKIEKTFVKHE